MAPRKQQVDQLTDSFEQALDDNPTAAAAANELATKIVTDLERYWTVAMGPFGAPATQLALAKALLPAVLKGRQSKAASEGEKEAQEAHLRVLRALGKTG